MTTEHAADQAGGEVVYASDGPVDGVAPTALPMRFPIRTHAGTSVSIGDAIGDTDTIDEASQTTAVQAFEVFSGKLYHPGSVQGTTGGKSGTRLQNLNETPLERLGRLQRELTELEEQATAAGGTNDMDTNSMIDKGDWNRTVSDLQTRLQQTQLKYSWSQQQQHLTVALERAVQQGEGATATATAAAAVAVAASTPAQAPSSPSSLQRVMRQGKGAPPLTTASTLPSLEERMRRVELAVGSNSTSTSSSTLSTSTSTWSERLRLMEQAVQKLDSKQLDMAVARSKVIRQDLEAASKARNKLLTSSRSAGADAATILLLHTAYTDLQGMAQYLSPLAQRLSVLARQHQDQATHGVRLLAVEETVTTLQQQLTSVETAVQQLQEGWMVNAAAMETNIKALDARMVVVKK